MKQNNTINIMSYLRKFVSSILSILLLLSIFLYRVPTAIAEDEQIPQQTEQPAEDTGNEQYQSSKENYSVAEKKVSTKLRQLAGVQDSASSMTQSETVGQMPEIEQTAPTTDGNCVYIYIYDLRQEQILICFCRMFHL